MDKKRRNPLQICLMGAARLMDFSRLFGLWQSGGIVSIQDQGHAQVGREE